MVVASGGNENFGLFTESGHVCLAGPHLCVKNGRCKRSP